LKLGDLSVKYESNGDPGCISSGCGDLGGVSFGAYQFAITQGIPQAFVQWLVNIGNSFGNRLSQYEVGTEEFNNEWQAIANEDSDGFLEVQHEYVKQQYYEVAANNLLAKLGFNIEEHSEALKQVLWSRSVQYNANWMCELFIKACDLAEEDIHSISDSNLIYYIYEYLIRFGEQDDWINGSDDVIQGLYNRFLNERQDALNMLNGG
jgi:hypothetical protein